MGKIADPVLKRMHFQISNLARKYQLRDRSSPIMGGLSVSQTYALTSLNRVGEMTMSELARDLRVSLGAATKVVDELERLGLVARNASAHDKRVQVVQVAQNGKDTYEEVHRAFLSHLRETLCEIPTHEREAVVNGLEVINRAIETWQSNLKFQDQKNSRQEKVKHPLKAEASGTL